jgi:predicted nucleic acid-binding protein
MTIAVIDAAALVDLLCRFPAAPGVEAAMRAASEVVSAAHLDAEVYSALSRLHRAGELPEAGLHVATLARMPIRRFPLPPLLDLAWSLPPQIAARDALYVALTQTLDGRLITTDGRLKRAAGRLIDVG